MWLHISDIIEYINYLLKQGYYITLHGEIIEHPQLVRFNFHRNPYCTYVKLHERLWPECVEHQEKVIEHCRYGEFFGCCHAGVSEFVYPITAENRIVGFISVSGYLDNTSNAKDKLRHLCEKKGISFEKINEVRLKALNTNIPHKKSVDVLVRPLVLMLENYHTQALPKGKPKSDLYRSMLHYIHMNIHENLTMDKISEYFNYSKSTLSRVFSKNCGRSFPQYMAELRIAEAKWLLRYTRISVTDAALLLGFCNANYFSTVFKSHVGISPKQYQQKMKQEARELDDGWLKTSNI